MQFILFFFCGLLSKEINAMFLPMSLEAYSVSGDAEIGTGYCGQVYGTGLWVDRTIEQALYQ